MDQLPVARLLRQKTTVLRQAPDRTPTETSVKNGQPPFRQRRIFCCGRIFAGMNTFRNPDDFPFFTTKEKPFLMVRTTV